MKWKVEMHKTKHLGLNITDIEDDKLQKFSFKTDLGDNFEAIDEEVLTHRNITNCILEVPQDIKLELTDGVLTLKAGSKVYIPNGFEADNTIRKFDVAVLESDISRNDFLTNGNAMVFVIFDAKENIFKLGQAPVSNVESGTSDTNVGYYYRTNENKIYSAGNWNRCSLPIMIGASNGTSITSIDQVFNGFGYIGSALFELPGVKGLIVEGNNDDGTLRTVIKTTTKVAIDSLVGVHSNSVISNLEGTLEDTIWLGESDNYPNTEGVLATPRFFNTKTNFIQIYGTDNNWINQYGFLQVFEDLKLDSTGKILSMIPKKPFRAVDHNDYHSKITELETKIQALQDAITALQG